MERSWLEDRKSLRTGHAVISKKNPIPQVPQSTAHRSLTAQLMGDPSPERSALATKGILHENRAVSVAR